METLQSFDSPDIDVKAWVNSCLEKALASQETSPSLKEEELTQAKESEEGLNVADPDTMPSHAGPAPLENHLSGILIRLQQESQTLNSKLEDQMAQLLGSIPRALREVDRIGRDSTALLRGVSKLDTQVTSLERAATPSATNGDSTVHLNGVVSSSVDSSTSFDASTIETLEHLHTIKTNLDQTIGVLEQSANWSRLAREVEEGFESQNLVGVAQRLSSLRASLSLLAGMPGSEQREHTLASMEERLETLIGPGLQDAIRTCLASEEEGESTENVQEAEERLQGLVKVFEKLGTTQNLCSEFASARASFLRKDWENSVASASRAQEDLGSWITRFYERFVSALEREAYRCERVFGKSLAGSVIESIAVEGLQVIGPELEGLLDSLSLASAIEIFEKTCQFADQVCRVSHQHGHHSSGTSLAESVAYPFRNLFEQYKELEHQTMTEALISRAGHISAATIRSLLGDPATITLPQAGLERCSRLSQGTLSLSFVSAVDEFWADICFKAAQVLKQMFSDINETSTESDEAWEEQTSSALSLLHEVAGFASRVKQFRDQDLRTKVSRLASEAISQQRSDAQHATDTSHLCLTHVNAKVLDTQALSALQRIIEDINFLPEHYLARSSAALSDLVQIAQTVAYETIMAPIQREWVHMGSMRVWSLHTDAQVKEFPSSEEEMISEFGSPLRYMTRVVKDLSSLVQLLEPFASKNASSDVLPDPHQLGKLERESLEELLHLEADARLTSLLKAEAEHDEQIAGGMTGDEFGDMTGDGDFDDDDEPLDQFSRRWLNVVALGASNSLILQISRISRLGDKGRQQLAADLSQLEYVISLIAAPHDAILEKLRSTLQMSTPELEQAAVEAASSGQDSPVVHIQQLVLTKVVAAASEASDSQM